jgi:choice-of-anchor C domain-containing protein
LKKRQSLLSMTGAVLAVVALSGSVMAAGDPVVNGSFEEGTWSGSLNYYPLEEGQPSGSAMTGWKVTSGTVDWIDGYWTSPSGRMSVDLNGTPTANVATPVAGTLTQTFTTKANASYVVSFTYAGNPDGGPAVKNATVSATGNTGQLITFDTTGHSTSSMGWITGGYSFVATGSSTTLTFAADTSNTSNQGIALDNIVITETLGPGAACKNSGWKAMHDTLGFSFKNQGDCVSFYATGEKNLASPTN